MNLADLRRNYTRETLSENDVFANPFNQFDHWFREAQTAQLPEPNAMTLATADSDGQPSARTVLLKGFDNQGFTFFTNYESRKGQDLETNPRAALLFTWLELERQIRIEGLVEKIRPEDSRAYFNQRPKDSQIGAWASPQSRVIESRGWLENRVSEIAEKYAWAEQLPLPPFWGGYCLKPMLVEFWQGRENRLHDRIQYRRLAGDDWKIERLSP